MTRQRVKEALDAHTFDSLSRDFSAGGIPAKVVTCSCGKQCAGDTYAEASDAFADHRADAILGIIQ